MTSRRGAPTPTATTIPSAARDWALSDRTIGAKANDVVKSVAPVRPMDESDPTVSEQIDGVRETVSSAASLIMNGTSEEIAQGVGALTVTAVVAAATRGRGKNKLRGREDAAGPHSSFARDKDGHIFKYETYNIGDDTNWHIVPIFRFDGGAPDGSPGNPHRNRSGEKVSTPHVQGKTVDAEVRRPTNQETPNNARFEDE